MQPFSDEQLNFFKFSSLVLNEFPKALRQTFKTMWDNTYGHRPGFQLWDDSTAVRKMFDSEEAKSGKKTKVPVLQSYNEWDCTNLFQATIFARSFASPASTGSSTTLNDLYVKPRAVPYGSFHACVVSPSGNMAETFALAIDQLRLLRNSLCHSISSEMDKPTFDQRVNYARDAFQALGVPTASIDALGSLTESDFPTNEVRKLEARIRDETRAYIKCLEDFREGLESVSSDINDLKQRVEVDNASKEDITRLEKKIDELKVGRDEHDNLLDNSGTILKNCSGRRVSLRFRQIVSKLQLQDWLIQPVPFSNKQPQSLTFSFLHAFIYMIR